MTADPGSLRRELSLVLREVAWTIHRRAPERAGVGPIPTTELALLGQVLTTPGATVGQLAAALGLRQPNVSAAIRVLAGRGLVVKEASPHDRRIVRIMPTELGRSEHEAIATAWSRPVEDAIASLSPEHRQALSAAYEALEALHEALTGASESQ
jgi:DNA-binding MarR family transcriptional regulator